LRRRKRSKSSKVKEARIRRENNGRIHIKVQKSSKRKQV